MEDINRVLGTNFSGDSEKEKLYDFIVDFNDRLLQGESKLLEDINSRSTEYQAVFPLICDIIREFQGSDKTLYSEYDKLYYALFENRDFFFKNGNVLFVKYIIETAFQVALDCGRYSEAIDYIIYLCTHFDQQSSQYYGEFISITDWIKKLDLLWEQKIADGEWGACTDYHPEREMFFDCAGPLGNLAYLRYELKKQAGSFISIETQADFIFDEITGIVTKNNPLAGIYLFSVAYEFPEFDTPEFKSKFSIYAYNLKKILEEKAPTFTFALLKFYRWCSFITKDKSFFDEHNKFWKRYLQEEIGKTKDLHIFTRSKLDQLKETNQYFSKVSNVIIDEDSVARIVWDLINFYETQHFWTWSIATMIAIDFLDFQRKLSSLEGQWSKILDLSAREFKGEEIEYNLKKEDYFFYIDVYLLKKLNEREKKARIHLILKKLYKGKKRDNLPFFIVPYERYNSLLLYYAIESVNLDFIEKVLRDTGTDHLFPKTIVQLTQLIRKISSNSSVNFQFTISNIEDISQKAMKEQFGLITIDNTQYQLFFEFVYFFIETLKDIWDVFNFLKQWENKIWRGSLEFETGWVPVKKRLLLRILKLEILPLNLDSDDFEISKFISLKMIVNFLLHSGTLFDNVLKGNEQIQTLDEKLAGWYSNFKTFFSHELIKRSRSPSSHFLGKLIFSPSIIPTSLKTSLRPNHIEISLIKKEFPIDLGSCKLRFRVKKEDFDKVIQEFDPFLFNRKNKRELIDQWVSFGVKWIGNHPTIKNTQISWHIAIDNGHSFEIEIEIQEDFKVTQEIVLVPYLKTILDELVTTSESITLSQGNYQLTSLQLRDLPEFHNILRWEDIERTITDTEKTKFEKLASGLKEKCEYYGLITGVSCNSCILGKKTLCLQRLLTTPARNPKLRPHSSTEGTDGTFESLYDPPSSFLIFAKRNPSGEISMSNKVGRDLWGQVMNKMNEYSELKYFVIVTYPGIHESLKNALFLTAEMFSKRFGTQKIVIIIEKVDLKALLWSYRTILGISSQ